MEEEYKKFFPHEKIRPVQEELVQLIFDTVKNKKNLIVHAPTGLGKTAAALAPALAVALDKDLTIFFLTSRHTQHQLAIDTLIHIKKKHALNFLGVDIVGKQSMCVQDHVAELYSNEFAEYCKSVREKNECEFYENTKNSSGKLTVKAKKIIEELTAIAPVHSEKMIEICKKEKICPYEVSAELSKKAKVIVSDYYYIFHPKISDSFFGKTGKKLENSIVIIDEGHNLPGRLRNLFTHKLSSYIIDRALKEAKKFNVANAVPKIKEIDHILTKLSSDMKEEQKESLITKDDFEKKVKTIDEDYDGLIADLEFSADDIRKQQRSSFLGSVAAFLNGWQGPDKGFSRILSRTPYKDKENILLSYRCLDPSLSSTVVFEHSYAAILMSGTLTPTAMYADLLGFPKSRTVQKEFGNPFPKKNKLTLIVPETTTKFTQRDESQFREIARICNSITSTIDGNSAIFFPSYILMDEINRHFSELSKKHIVKEIPGLSKEGKYDLLETFKEESKNKGSVLLGVATGSFGEGVDFPNNLLKCVIVVGIPLQKPDLETTQLIEYYDKKFGNGWDYGYIYPAILKSLQNAGRCIRSETDKGVIVFLDKRYAWPGYKKCFPDSEIIVTQNYLERIKEFFNEYTN
jgi:DNA excision repair protein ERCC-2